MFLEYQNFMSSSNIFNDKKNKTKTLMIYLKLSGSNKLEVVKLTSPKL